MFRSYFVSFFVSFLLYFIFILYYMKNNLKVFYCMKNMVDKYFFYILYFSCYFGIFCLLYLLDLFLDKVIFLFSWDFHFCHFHSAIVLFLFCASFCNHLFVFISFLLLLSLSFIWFLNYFLIFFLLYCFLMEVRFSVFVSS